MTNFTPSPTIYESFNARSLDPAQVAATFVPPAHFRALAKRNHALVVGPRGSGKTTLLKMLQQPALSAWQHPEADTYRRLVDFTGVFIPSDIAWTRQLDSLGDGDLPDLAQRIFARAAFTTHILKALVASFIHRACAPVTDPGMRYGQVVVDAETEASIVQNIAPSWSIRPTIATFASLASALSARLVEIPRLASQEAWRDPIGRGERIAEHVYLHLDFLSAVSHGVHAFNSHTDPEHRWALLFDELEIVPRWLQDHLVDALRSSDQRLLFKLSLSPFSHEAARMQHVLAAMPGNDYEEIALWYTEKWEGHQFCKDLWSSVLQSRGFAHVPADVVLGRSVFWTGKEDWEEAGTAYSAGSSGEQLLQRMHAKDRSVRLYLEGQGVDVNALSELAPDHRAATVRKYTPLLTIREAYRTYAATSKGGAARRIRSRKIPFIYTGAPTVFEITEGNPRWFIGLVSRLLDTVVDAAAPRVDRKQQARAIRDAGNRFRAMIRTLPGPGIDPRSRGLLTLLDAVGESIFDAVVVTEFSGDPPGTFIVDSRSSDATLAALQRALNAGAIVFVQDQSDSGKLLASLRGKRFRLSYLLAPGYGCPIRLGRAVSLSSIVQPHQPWLFNEQVE